MVIKISCFRDWVIRFTIVLGYSLYDVTNWTSEAREGLLVTAFDIVLIVSCISFYMFARITYFQLFR